VDLVLVRHGAAEDREAFAQGGGGDEQRPLTERGRRKVYAAAQGLKALLPRIDLLATSPLLRARQTAAILADAYGRPAPIAIRELAPDASRASLQRWLRRQSGDATLVLVGHEPNLGELASWLTDGTEPIALKKGGACLLRVSGDLRAGSAALAWRNKAAELGRATTSDEDHGA
jgi:phosphohistidine phosphatase